MVACNDDKNQNEPQIKTFEATYSDSVVKAIDEVVQFNHWTYYKLWWATNNNKKVMLVMTNQFVTTKDSIKAFIDSLQKIKTFFD